MQFGYRYRLLCIVLLVIGVMMLIFHIYQNPSLALFSFNPIIVSLLVVGLGVILLMLDTTDHSISTQNLMLSEMQQVMDFKVATVRQNPAISEEELTTKVSEFIKLRNLACFNTK